MVDTQAIDEAAPTPKKWVAGLRLGVLLFLILGLVYWARQSGFAAEISVEKVQTWVLDAGPLGLLLYVAIYSVGIFVQVPGWIFITAGGVIFGPIWGILWSWLASCIAITVTFVFVRTIGGQPLGTLKHPLFLKAMTQLEQRPVRTVFLLRLVVWVAPPLTYALALSNVKLRDYVLGSALGLFLPCVAFVLFASWLLEYIA